MNAKRLTRLGLLSAIALTIFMVENQIPPLVPLPGIKLGLSNIVTVFAVFFLGAKEGIAVLAVRIFLGAKEGIAVLAVRIFLGAVFAGNFSTILYSAAGGALAILITVTVKPILKPGQIWVAGCLGAIAHSVGQMAVAVAVTGTPGLLAWLPIMILCSMVTGCFTGLCAQYLVKRGKNLWKTFLP